ncbi:DNA -binding domain-containing protein [Sphingobium sp. CAP-1]|uniref:DNA -binding domain-containing protein n=1 Tax=Sphingobium sp. CAP-1 TaxID=2676077 RepID=UPI0012BB3108|nr:DUF2285 domain-containing protein [Sphingobium sp. CAP-1]
MGVRVVYGQGIEHVAVDTASGLFRIDIVAGTVTEGAIALHFCVADDARLSIQLDTIKALRFGKVPSLRRQRLVRRLAALHAIDAREGGASLRDIADLLLGPGDWPGDGEYRKSHVRRLVDAGERMIRSGPGAILRSM